MDWVIDRSKKLSRVQNNAAKAVPSGKSMWEVISLAIIKFRSFIFIISIFF